MTRIYDAHAHLGSEAERRVRREQDIVTMVCAGTLAQAERLSEEAARNANILPAAGLHPWHCDKCSVGTKDSICSLCADCSKDNRRSISDAVADSRSLSISSLMEESLAM